jgi:hypothetical protein
MKLKPIQACLIISGTMLLLSACGDKQQTVQGPPSAVPVTVNDVRTTSAVYYDEYPELLSH